MKLYFFHSGLGVGAGDIELKERVAGADLAPAAKDFFTCLFGIAASEAVCETLGSIMEEGQERFTGAAHTDESLQRELFLKYSGPEPGQDFEVICHQFYLR